MHAGRVSQNSKRSPGANLKVDVQATLTVELGMVPDAGMQEAVLGPTYLGVEP